MKSLLTGIAALVLLSGKPVEEIDYKKVFGGDYTWAVNWLKQNDQLIFGVAGQYHIPAKELKAIVFPELVRYNRVFDAIQIESLKYLYVTEGKTYADFSVGYFQMKPSFAETVERDAGAQFDYHLQKENEDTRRERLGRLTNTRQQIIYLCAFYGICERRFAFLKFSSLQDKLKLFSTSYNAGYQKSYETLMTMQHRKQFLNYNYSDISLYYFEKEL